MFVVGAACGFVVFGVGVSYVWGWLVVVAGCWGPASVVSVPYMRSSPVRFLWRVRKTLV